MSDLCQATVREDGWWRCDRCNASGWVVETGAVTTLYCKREASASVDKKHSHYFRPCPFPEVDVYRLLDMFCVTHPCAQHAAKKILFAGVRGAKDIDKDIQEAIDTLTRWQAMRAEERPA